MPIRKLVVLTLMSASVTIGICTRQGVTQDEPVGNTKSDSQQPDADGDSTDADSGYTGMRHYSGPALPDDYKSPFGDPFDFATDFRAGMSDNAAGGRGTSDGTSDSASSRRSENSRTTLTNGGVPNSDLGIRPLRKPSWPPDADVVDSVVRTYDGVAQAAENFRRRQSEIVDGAEDFNSTVKRGNEQISRIQDDLEVAQASRKSELDRRKADIEVQFDNSRFNLCPRGHSYDDCSHEDAKALWERRKQDALSNVDRLASSADGDIRRLKDEIQAWKIKTAEYAKQQQKLRQQQESGNAWVKKFNAGDALWSIFNK